VNALRCEVALACTREGIVTWADERAIHHLGAIVGSSLERLALPGTEPKLAALLERAAAGPVRRFEVSLVVGGEPATFAFDADAATGDGELLLVGRPVIADDATTFGRVAETIADLAELHRETQRRAELGSHGSAPDDGKDEFLAMLAHELRNPLSAILTATTLLDAYALPPGAARLSVTIGRQTRHLARIVDDLLDVARVKRGKIQLRTEPVDLAALVERFLAGAFELTQHHRITVSISDAPLWVAGDSIRLEQVLSNLVGNAVKYTRVGGAITISVGRGPGGEPGSVVLVVRDSGVGISREHLGSVFDVFFQVDSTLARSQSGLGLGLTIVKRLVEMHGGTIRADSAGLGAGTELRVELPRIEAAQPDVAAAPAAAPPGASRISVLLVDDNVDSCELVGLYFERQGHQVTCANDGQEGLERALDDRFDVAVVDIGLPTIDGYEVARRIRAARKESAPVLLALTGYGRSEDRRRALDAGFDAHIVKPVDIRELHRTALALVRARQERAGPGSPSDPDKRSA
jgi:signal transduction histidine kinase/CheY-like chemotaxis protein